MSRSIFAIGLSLLFVAFVRGDDAPRFAWKAGEVLTFDVTHATSTVETAAIVVNGPAVNSRFSTKMTLRRVWTVEAVDATGTATLGMAITAFKNESTRSVPGPDGKMVDETTALDSATPEGAKAVAAYLNKTILTATVDPRGRVIAVKADTAAAASRLKAELPFRIEWPERPAPQWRREFAITLDPPAGTGEAIDTMQTMEKAETPGTYKVAVALKKPPSEAADLQPLLPFLWEGTVTTDPATHAYTGCSLAIKKVLNEHQGKGTKFEFESTYDERRVQK